MVSIPVLAALVAGPAASAARAAGARGDWVESGFDAGSTNFNPYERTLGRANVAGLTPVWNFDIDSNSPPAVVGNRVYVETTTAVNAYDAQTGEIVWSHPVISHPFEGTIAVVGGVVYTMSSPDSPTFPFLYALRAGDGTQLWKLRVPDYFDGADLVVADGLLYLSTHFGKIYVVDTTTHAIVRKLRGQFSISRAVIADGRVFAADSGHLYAFDAATGKRDWSLAVDEGPATAVDGVVVAAAEHDSISALDESSGSTLWSFSTGTKFVGAIVVAKGTVYFGDYNGMYDAFDLHTGKQRWSVDLGSQVTDASTVANGVVYTVTADKNLRALDARTGAPLFAGSAGARADSDIVVSHGNVFFTGGTGRLRRWVLQD